MNSSSIQDKLSSFAANLLLFDQTSLLSYRSDRNHPIYSDVQVGQAPREPKDSYHNSPERNAWSLLQEQKYSTWILSVTPHLSRRQIFCSNASLTLQRTKRRNYSPYSKMTFG
jgi:hypothetical protein